MLDDHAQTRDFFLLQVEYVEKNSSLENALNLKNIRFRD